MAGSAEPHGSPSHGFDHATLWQAIDTLAAEHGLSPSGLAREAGLDPTAFNPSKRRDPKSGSARWPTLETLSRVLGATTTSFEAFARLVGGARTLRPIDGPSPPIAAATGLGRVPLLPFERLTLPGLFDAGGYPQGEGWLDIELTAPAAAGCYAVRLDAGWAPVWRPRALLVVDPQTEPRAGDLVLRYDTACVRLMEAIDPAVGLFAPPFGQSDVPTSAAIVDDAMDAAVPLRLHRIVWASQ